MHRFHHHWSGGGHRWSRHGFGGHMGRGFRGGRRLGRLLDHGDLRFVLLALIEAKPAHGYELIRALEERTGGAYRPSPGVIYPTLSLLEDEGFATPAAAEGGRKSYAITESGREALAARRPEVEAVFARLDEAAAASPMSSLRVQRAMENLKTALKLRLSRGALDEAAADAIAAAIDEAAAKVERV